jgi:anti-sigma factor RsiW
MKHAHPSIERIVDYTRGELSARDDADVYAHLAECPACAGTHDQERRLTELLKAHARADERELPLGFASAIRARAAADEGEPAWWSRHSVRAMLRPAAAVGIAALLVIAFVVSFTIPRGPANANTITPSAYLENHAALSSTVPFEDGTNAPIALTADEGR